MLEPSAPYIRDMVDTYRPTILVIESQWFRLGMTDAVIGLLKQRYTWEAFAEIQHARVVAVSPQTWQKHHGIVAPKDLRGPKNAGRRSRWIKATIMARAQGLAVDRNSPKPQPDEADALCILAWAQDAERLGVLS